MQRLRAILVALTAGSAVPAAPAPKAHGQWGPPADPQFRARYDAAQTVSEDSAHWRHADDLSARAANSPEVRRILRQRCRYEAANNCLVRGLMTALANDAIGTGPMLQLNTGDRETDSRIEASWRAWCREQNLACKLRVMIEALGHDGEAFGLLTTNQSARHAVKLHLKLIEADQVATSYGPLVRPDQQDGVEVDDNDIPQAYHLLRAHPGDPYAGYRATQHDVVSASTILHLMRPTRAGQLRGVPLLAPALPIFAQLRRYTLATLTAAETAASHAGVVTTSVAPDADQLDDMTGQDVPIPRGSFSTLPPGWTLSQLKAEQPTNTYRDFKHELLGEAARCVMAPFCVAAGNSSGYNYSSGRLDFQAYDRSFEVLRDELRARVLDPLFAMWLREAVLITGLLGLEVRQQVATGGELEHEWLYRARGHVDPTKEAEAAAMRIAASTSTLARECALEGLDWEDVVDQRIREELAIRDRRAAAGLPPREDAQAPSRPAPVPASRPDQEDET